MSERPTQVDERVPGGRHRLVRAGPVVVALVGVVVGVAACSSGSTGPGVASLGSTTSTTTVSPVSQGGIGSANYTDAVAYAQCMRSHGVANFPDPNSQGNFLLGKSTHFDPDTRRYNSADKACRHLLPNGGQISPAQQQQMLAAALRFVACMRTHGIASFPDPTTSGGGVGFNIDPRVTGLDPRSQTFQAAQKACQPLLPGGGP
jgi:hypothetical protein